MIDISTIFRMNDDGVVYTDVSELLMTIANPSISIDDKRIVWNLWVDKYYDKDCLMEFFQDTLFNCGDVNYLDIIVKTENYTNFYEFVLSLDLANVDPKAYYIFWILNYGHKHYTQIVKDALEYDPDTIHMMLPDLEEVLGI